MERDADGIGWHTSVLPGGTPGRENSVPSPTVSKINTSFGGSVGVASTPSNEECVSGCVENNASGTDFTAVPSDGNAVTSSTDITTSTLDIIIASSTVGTTTPSDSSLPLDATSTSLVLPSSSPPLASPLVNHLLIAAIQTGGVAANNDLVKIYNPTDGVVDVSGWKLRKRSQTGTDYSIREFSAGTTVLPRSYLVWANSADGFAESVNADVSSTQTLAADNSVALIDANGKTIDAVAWGAGTGQYGEGTPYPTSPVSGQTLARQSANFIRTEINLNKITLLRL